jgi:hypothetical protein
MKTKNVIWTLFLLGILEGSGIAQTEKPNFSGTWLFDKEKSDLGAWGGEGQRPSERDKQSDSANRGGRMGGPGMPRVPAKIVIEHKDPQLSIKRTMVFGGEERVQEVKYTTDGETNSNEGFRGRVVESKTHWEGDRLVTQSNIETPRGPVETTETRSLSSDGGTMTVEVTAKGGPMEGTRKLVYNKEKKGV